MGNCHWRIGLAPRFFDLGRGELVFFRRFPVFFEQNPTLNRKKSFRCAKGRAFSFFSGRKKFFLSPKRASPTSSPYSPEVIGEVVTAGGTMFARRNVPLQMLAPGILLAKLLGVHRQPWAQATISRTRPSFRVERAIRGTGRVARPMWHGTTFSGESAKVYSPPSPKS